ncbi:hypothetical protein WA026_021752 [Henosepilachna vigintioctopunctata]|uniref:Uncharacterized protein n=1 Tax=Henosepilachna vigintioctopunctata TaxID=420089 RepID=A0AAW1TSF6_9CUCU
MRQGRLPGEPTRGGKDPSVTYLVEVARGPLATRKHHIDFIKVDTARQRKENFGELREYTRKADGVVVAVKTLKSARGERFREHEILKVLNPVCLENVLYILECFETPGQHQFIFPRMEGDFERYLRENGPCQSKSHLISARPPFTIGLHHFCVVSKSTDLLGFGRTESVVKDFGFPTAS